MISPPWIPWCSSTYVNVIVLVILRRASRCSCLNRLYWILHYLCKNHCVTPHRLIWAFLITSKSWVLNIWPIYRFRVIPCTKLDSGLMAGLILRQVYGKMSLKTIIHTISHQLINQSILSPYWSFTFSKSCNDLTSHYNASMNRYNVSTNRYNVFRRYQTCQKIGQYGVKMLTTLCISFNVSESHSNDSRNRYNDLWYMLTFQRMVQALLTSCEAL
jgi:hypothetical protein